MKTARLVREIPQAPYRPGAGWRDSTKLWEMAMEGATFVATEARAVYGKADEVLFWAAGADGRHVLGPTGAILLGSVRGTLDHEVALVVAGYLPSNSEPCLCGQFSPVPDGHGIRCAVCRGLGVEPSDEQAHVSAHVSARAEVRALLPELFT